MLDQGTDNERLGTCDEAVQSNGVVWAPLHIKCQSRRRASEARWRMTPVRYHGERAIQVRPYMMNRYVQTASEDNATTPSTSGAARPTHMGLMTYNAL